MDHQSIIFLMGISHFSHHLYGQMPKNNTIKDENADNGVGHTGDVYFVRGDLYSNEWYNNGPDAEVVDSFFVSDHPNDGEWNEDIFLRCLMRRWFNNIVNT